MISVVLISSPTGLSVTAVFSVAPCVQSWQMCNGMDTTRLNLELWSETFLEGPSKVPLSSPTACPLFLTTTHWQPTTSSLKPHKILPWLDWWTGHESHSSLNPALHPSHHLFYYSPSITARQGHSCKALIKADFTGQTEKCHLQAAELLPYSTTELFFIHPHTSNRARSNGRKSTQTQQQ